MLPSITSNEAQITLSTADGLTKEESYAIAGQVAEAALNVENVEEVGITLDTSMAGLDISQLGLPTAITDILNSANAYGRYKINVMMSKSLSSREVEKTRQAMEDAVSQIENCTAEVKLYGMTDDLTSQLATGLSVKVYGKDPETLTTVSEKVMEIVNDTEGFANADNGLGSGDATIILKVDRDKVRAYGLTVAEVYQKIAQRLNTRAMGYGRMNADSVDRNNLMQYLMPQDLRSFGLIPELVGRLPVLTYMEPLGREALRSILTQPKNAIIKQYEKLFEMDGVKLVFDDEVLDYIVDKAIEYRLGARGLRSICEAIMMDTMFDIPSSGERRFEVTLPYAREKFEKKKFLALKQVG